MNAIPDGLPTLSAGDHDPGEGKACVMEYVSILAGEEWTDMPHCTHPTLAKAAQSVNDILSDGHRHLLVPLIGRLFGAGRPADKVRDLVLIRALAVYADPTGGGTTFTDFTYPRMVEALASGNDLGAAYYAGGVAVGAVAKLYRDTTHSVKYNTLVVTGPDGAAGRYVAETLVGFLSGLIDVYDEVTGRTEHRVVTAEDLAFLAAKVGQPT